MGNLWDVCMDGGISTLPVLNNVDLLRKTSGKCEMKQTSGYINEI